MATVAIICKNAAQLLRLSILIKTVQLHISLLDFLYAALVGQLLSRIDTSCA
jgi:hypothetical protein